MEFQDRQLTCRDCGQMFTFTAGEQEFYEKKGFREEPKRCKPCREVRKARRDQGGDSAAPGAAPGGPSEGTDEIGNRGPRGPREVREVGGRRGPRELFDAVCAQCGQPTKVPFRPVAGRPVYCRECYGNRSQGG